MPTRYYIGFLIGMFIPLCTFLVSHHESNAIWQIALSAGGLAFSAPTVYDWASLAFKSRFKAIGFILLLEGTMVFASVPYLPLACLVYLVAINGHQTGLNLARKLVEKATGSVSKSPSRKPSVSRLKAVA